MSTVARLPPSLMGTRYVGLLALKCPSLRQRNLERFYGKGSTRTPRSSSFRGQSVDGTWAVFGRPKGVSFVVIPSHYLWAGLPPSISVTSGK